MKEKFLIKILNKTDALLKFPNLRKGEIGIQVGFDLSSKNLTTDVIKMHKRTKRKGVVIAIDPDPSNHIKLKEIIKNESLSIICVQKGTFSRKTNEKLVLGVRASHNIMSSIGSDKNPIYTNDKIEVELDTLDNIIAELKIDDYSKIRHINITNNGAEFQTLLGMENILNKCENLNLTIASGRPNKIGEIDGKRDYEVIMQFLEEKGFNCKLLRMNKSFWWGVVINLFLKQRWIFNKTRFGVVMASRGNRRIKFYQTYS